MKALILKEYKHFELQDVPVPEPGATDVLVAVRACGICGSDVHGMDGSSGRRRPPIIMGHEAAGVIAGIGSAVSGWSVGDRVTFDSTIYCGQCFYCRRGQINLCDNRRVLGVSCEDYRQSGAFADFVVVPERILYRLPDQLPFEHAAMVEPFTIALHAIRRAPPALNDSVVIVGAGMIGLALAQALKQTGCGQLIVLDVADDRLALAKSAGATHTINSGRENALESILALTGKHGADIAFEAVGINATVDTTLRSLRKGGTAVLVGNVTPEVELPLQVAVTRELTVLGSCASSGEYPAVLDMMARGALDPAPLISAVAPLRDGAPWFDRLYRKEAGLLKVVLTP
jgi:L-iditol 2-dehydrogenase